MLENVRQVEEETIKRYIKRVKQADALGMVELKMKLEDTIADETNGTATR